MRAFTDKECRSLHTQLSGWLSHQLTYETVDGTQTREVTRLASNVLIWESDGVTYRLESALDLASSLRLAETLAPVRDDNSEP